MNDEFLKDINEIKEQFNKDINELKEKFDKKMIKLEEKYLPFRNSKLMVAVLEQLNIDHLVVSLTTVSKATSLYQAEYKLEDNKVIISKIQDGTSEVIC